MATITVAPLNRPIAAPLKRRTNVDAAGQSFEDRLRSARLAAGLMQTELSEMAGLARPVVYDLENGRHKGATQARTVAALAKALSVSMHWLWLGDEPCDD